MSKDTAQKKTISTQVLIVEDDQALREAIADTLALHEIAVTSACHAKDALACLEKSKFDVMISDVNMPGMDGHELLEKVKEHFPWMPVILMTAYGTIEKSVSAMQQGASDYLVKPFEVSQLMETLNQYLVHQPSVNDDLSVFDTKSLELLSMSKRVAQTDSTVLIAGESGTGKEVLARYIHQQSPRHDKPFVAINCAAIPETMLEATLFGYEKGAFTNAYQSTPGKFEQANGGTILLDEISEMDLALQAKILRVIQEREVERLGGKKTISLDVRILATTNRNLLQEAQSGKFREDLYYRLSVFPLKWSPLRERPSDIMPIANTLLKKHCDKMQRDKTASLSKQAINKIESYAWPGNVRELENVIQRALILQPGHVLQAEDFQFATVFDELQNQNTQNDTVNLCSSSQKDLSSQVQNTEFSSVLDALSQSAGNRKEAAGILQVSERTLRYKMAKMREAGINVDEALESA